MRSPFTGLWRHPEFLKLWMGQTVSLLGSQVTALALPLTAVLTLHATAAQMGILNALQFAPFLLFGLAAGVWVDRVRRRPLLIAADAGRALLLATIPLAAAAHALHIELLYLVGFGTGAFTVCFDVAYQSFLPVLVTRQHLVEGNSKLELSRALAQVAGPGTAGALVQALTAPTVIVVDALSYVVSVLSLLLIRTPEPTPARGLRRSLRHEVGEGVRLVLGNPVLRGIAACTATSNLFGYVLFTVIVLYITRSLGLPPAAIGVIFAAIGPGGLLGAAFAGRIARHFGVGRTLVAGMLGGNLAALLVLAAHGNGTWAVVLLVAANILNGAGGTVYNITQVSLRQAITPDATQGRVNATMRFLVWGTIPIGSLIGGALGDALGLRQTIAVGAAGGFLAPLCLLLTPVRALHKMPEPAVDGV